jgi:H+/Cl- antiporter ClcA
MAESDHGIPAESHGIQEDVQGLFKLTVAYFKQETVIPLQALGRYIGFGLAGALLLGFGVIFLAVGALRALQTETGDTFSANWSWVPYAIVVVGLALCAFIVWKARGARKGKATGR